MTRQFFVLMREYNQQVCAFPPITFDRSTTATLKVGTVPSLDWDCITFECVQYEFLEAENKKE
jgi:hypothetical protein